AYRGIRGFEPNTHILAWLVRIMQNRFIDDYRRRQRRPLEQLTGDIGDWQRHVHECRTVGGDSAERVRAAVRQLPRDLRFAIYYAYMEGREYKEIARLQGIPVGTVMSRLYRARRRLRELLGGEP